MVNSFRKLSIHLGFDEKSTEAEDPEKAIDWVVSWLQERTRWLLLLDNGDDDKTVRKLLNLLPRIGGNIILTTRLHIPERNAKTIRIDKMEEEEALLLLFGNRSTNLVEQKSSQLTYAREIVKELDFMPLSIDLARAYINEMLLSFQDYLNMFKESKTRISLLRYRDEENLNCRYTVATVWQLSLSEFEL